jgi:hypothetical protein
MPTSFTSYTTEITYITLVWILQPMHFTLLPLNNLHQTMVYTASIATNLDSRDFYILFNVFPNPIYVLAII